MKTRLTRTLSLMSLFVFLAMPTAADFSAPASGDFLISAAVPAAHGTKIPERY